MNFSAASPTDDFVLIVAVCESEIDMLRTRNPHKYTERMENYTKADNDILQDWFDWFDNEITKPENKDNCGHICGSKKTTAGGSVSDAVTRTYFIVY